MCLKFTSFSSHSKRSSRLLTVIEWYYFMDISISRISKYPWKHILQTILIYVTTLGHKNRSEDLNPHRNYYSLTLLPFLLRVNIFSYCKFSKRLYIYTIKIQLIGRQRIVSSTLIIRLPRKIIKKGLIKFIAEAY